MYLVNREIKRKNGNYVTEAFENIFKTEKRVPKQIQTDDGNEFINKQIPHNQICLHSRLFLIMLNLHCNTTIANISVKSAK